MQTLEIKGGVIEGKVSSVEQITALAKLPNREVYYLLLYYKRQSATWLTLSKQWQRNEEVRLQCSLIQTNKKQTI